MNTDLIYDIFWNRVYIGFGEFLMKQKIATPIATKDKQFLWPSSQPVTPGYLLSVALMTIGFAPFHTLLG